MKLLGFEFGGPGRKSRGRKPVRRPPRMRRKPPASYRRRPHLRAAQETRGSGFTGTLPEGGRSSVPTTADPLNTLKNFGSIQPVVPHDYIEVIEALVRSNPDYSQAVSNFVSHANTGHELVIESESDAVADAVLENLNETAIRICPAGGIDALINQQCRQVISTGALSSEAVIDASATQVKRVVLVPTKLIRFRTGEDGEPEPWQRLTNFSGAGGEMVKLNPLTYSYLPLWTEGDNPYAIPPFLAALEMTVVQQYINENLKFIVKKLGLIGFIDVIANAPMRTPQQSDKQYEREMQSYLQSVRDAVQDNYYNGMLVHYRDIEIAMHHISEGLGAGLSGVVQVLHHVEALLLSGLDIDPAMMGRSYSKTETYANAVYRKMVRRAMHLRALVKFFIEKVYRLQAILSGFSDVSILLQFEENPPFDLDKASQYKETDIRAALMKVESGLADPDVVAAELGYDSWYDLSKLALVEDTVDNSQARRGLTVERILRTARELEKGLIRRQRGHFRFRFQPEMMRYYFVAPKIHVSSLETSRAGEEEALEEFIGGYLKRLRPFDERWREAALDAVEAFLKKHSETSFATAEKFAEALLGELERTHKIVFERKSVRREISETVEEIYTFYRLKDDASLAGLMPDLSLLEADTATMEFVRNIDSWFFSKFIRNDDMRDSLLKFFREEYLLRGSGIFTGGTQDLEAFRDLFAGRLSDLSDWQIRRVISTSIQRIRNFAHIRSYAQAGIEAIVVVAVLDKKTSALCRSLNGKIIRVEQAVESIDRITAMSAEDYGEFISNNSLDADYVRNLFEEMGDEAGMSKLLAEDVGLPPYHPNCRTQTRRQRIATTGKSLWARRLLAA